MNFDKLNERWKSLVLWWMGMRRSTDLFLERIQDSGKGFDYMIITGLIVLILALKYLRFA